MNPQGIIIAGLSVHLQRSRLVGHLTDRLITSNEIMVKGKLTLLPTMTEAETSIERCFTRNLVKVFFVVSL